MLTAVVVAPSRALSRSDDALLAGMGELAPGRRLGRYELVAPVGRGGMGVVWVARLEGARGFSKLFAVKTMFPALSADPRFEQMFLTEASLASAVRHPNVCEVIELGESDGLLYLVMEWVDGETLAALAAGADAPAPPGVVARIGVDVARGLHAAHEALGPDGARLGIVHRDVSPQNVLVGLDGIARIADFGIAKRDGGGTTDAGFTKGKVRYMAPEQVYCESVDPRTDVFALGVVLYEASTGRHPFAGPTDMATLARIADPVEATPPSGIVPGYPGELEAVVMRAVSKEPSARFATMAELGEALEEAVKLATAEEVRRLLEERCGERIAARRALTQPNASAAGLASPEAPDPGDRVRGGREVEGVAAAPQARRPRALAVAALATAVIAIGAAVTSALTPPTAAAPQPPVSADTPAPQAVIPARIAEPPAASAAERAAEATAQAASAPPRHTGAAPPAHAAPPRAPSASPAVETHPPPTAPKKSGVLETRE